MAMLRVVSLILPFGLLTGMWMYYVQFGPAVWTADLAVVLYIAVGLLFFWFFTLHFMLLAPYYIAQLTAVISNAYLERGVYISEQYRHSYTTGSTLGLVTYTLIFMAVAIAVFSALAPGWKLRAYLVRWKPTFNKYIMAGLFGLILLVVVVSGVSLALFGSPLTTEVTRFEYWKSHPFPYLWRLFMQFAQVAFLLGVIHAFSQKKSYRAASILALLVFLLINILHGDKFSSNFWCLVSYAVGYFTVRALLDAKRPPVLKLMPYAMSAVVVFYALISWSYQNIDKVGSDAVAQYMFDRAFALQGHTWWGIDELMKSGQKAVGLESLFHVHSAVDPGGLYLLMFAIAPPRSVEFYLEQGITFTMGGPAIAVYTLGYFLAGVYQIVAGIMVGACLAYLLTKIARKQLFLALVALKINWVMNLSFNMGNPYLFFSATFALYLAIVGIDVLIRRGHLVSWMLFIKQWLSRRILRPGWAGR